MQTLSRADIARMEADMAEFFAPTVRKTGKHAEPFAKRAEGMNRRIERKRRIAEKHSALNS